MRVDVQAAGPVHSFGKRNEDGRWSELLWFRPGIKRNLEWAAMLWVRNREIWCVQKRSND
jgi:hypothetical protein